jgi:hypothetical protein
MGRYGTPRPPLARRAIQIPRTRAALLASLRRPKVVVGIVASVVAVVVSGALIARLLAPPERPRLDLDGGPIALGPLSFVRPVGWVVIPESNDFSRPVVLMAPQSDPTEPPITISIVTAEVTDRYDAIVTRNQQIGDYDVLVALVSAAANDVALPTPTMSRTAYNQARGSSLARVALLAEWSDPVPWRPTTTVSPSPMSPAPSAPPIDYPRLGAPIDGVGFHVVSFYALPDTKSFVGRDATGRPFRRILVISLAVPVSTPDVVAAEARRAFDRLIASLVVEG